MNGLTRNIQQLKGILSRGNLTSDQRQRAQNLLSLASKRLDNAEKAIAKQPNKSKSELDKQKEKKKNSEPQRNQDQDAKRLLPK